MRLTWLLPAVLAGCTSHGPDPVGGDVAFVNVGVVSMREEGMAEARTVVVANGVITHIAPDAEVSLAEGVRIVDGSGRYLIPGLHDMHDHVTGPASLKQNVVFGVTTVRNLWGTQDTLKWRESVRSGEIIGPEIVTASPIIDDDPPSIPGSALLTRPEDADEMVRQFKEAGYDFLKPYRLLKKDVYAAMMEAAHKYDMPVSGHMPEAIHVAEAIEMGQQGIEHATGFSAAIVTDGFAWSPAFRSREMVETVVRVNSGEAAFEDVFDRDRLRALSRQAAAAGTGVSVTMAAVGLRAFSGADRIALKRHPMADLVEPAYRALWFGDDAFDALVNRKDPYTDEEIESLTPFVTEEFGRWIGIMHEEGVLLLGGTDAPNPGLFHGWSLHDELIDLVTWGGLTPFEALETVTVNPAKFWKEEGKRGIVAEGAQADLVLLSANPLEDITATRSIDGVMVDGRWLDRDALDELLLTVRTEYARGDNNE